MTNVFALLRLLPMSSRDKDAEILALRHQLSVLQWQLAPDKVRFTPGDRALVAALLHRLPRNVLKRLHLVVRPDTVLRWHRDVVARRHARRSRRPGRPRTVRSVRGLVSRLVRENPGWGYRRVHGELLVLGVKVAASTVWEILCDAGIDPAPERSATAWAGFLRSQAGALLACLSPAGGTDKTSPPPSWSRTAENRPPGCTAFPSQTGQSGCRVTGQSGRGSAKQAVPRTAPSARTLSARCP